VLDSIVREVEAISPALVVDSFRTVIRSAAAADGGDVLLDHFIHRLGRGHLRPTQQHCGHDQSS